MVCDKINVEVVYAIPNNQKIIALSVKQDTNIEEVIQLSGILTLFPDIDLTTQKVGVFSKVRDLCDKVKEGDRIEIYRPLLIDPKEARRKKVAKQK